MLFGESPDPVPLYVVLPPRLTMKKMILLTLCLSWLIGLLCVQPSNLFASGLRPNIVVILADDLGYGDVQCYNPERSKIPTPHMDRLALQGMRFTDAHSSSGVCSPSRYALLTGRYHWRTRLQTGIITQWERPLIAPGRMTIGTLAKQHGYRTAAVGKWHLGWNWPLMTEQKNWMNADWNNAVVTEQHRQVWQEVFSKPIASGPTTRGFDFYFGTDVPNWPPYCFINNDRTVGIPSEFLPPEKYVGSHRELAIPSVFVPHGNYVGGQGLASRQGPALPNWQFESILTALGDQAERFITESAAQSEPFLLYMPLTSPHTPLAPSEEWQGKSGLNHPVADLIMETDAIVGRIINILEKTGQMNNTLIVFTSDNGFESRVNITGLEKQGHFPSGPLREYKTSVYEGGHRIPFIVCWHGVVKPNTVNHQLVHQADLMATFAEVLGSTLPADAGEDSFSILPLLQGEDRAIREHAVSCAAQGIPGVRLGSWKLIAKPQPELYNLSDDIGETKDLAAQFPERVEQIFTLYEKLVSDGRSTPGPKQKNDVNVPKRH